MYERILIPLDGSELAEGALDHAEKIAKAFDAEITLFRVVPVMPFLGYMESLASPSIDEKAEQLAERYLDSFAKELEKKGLKVTTKMKTGQHVAAQIIDFAKESGTDLILLFTQGHSRITQWAWKRVAHKIFTRAETPMFIIHL
jgi:nucleotide-binding universal stress UspA family protein